MSQQNLKGVIVPATTPFDAAGEIDFDAISPQLNWLIRLLKAVWKYILLELVRK